MAYIGPGNASYIFHVLTNRNEQYPVDFLQEYNLTAANRHFQKRMGKLWRHESKTTPL